jgi:transcriptional regulator GlxA family with amidase domain
MPPSLGSQKLSPPERAVRPLLSVGIILAEHFTLSAFAVFIDHLRLAADEGDRSRPMHVQWSIMSCRRDPVRASCGVTLQPTSGLLPPASVDYVVVVGGILHAGPQIDEATTRYLREVGATRTPLIGICTGSFVLCRAGLMEGRRSCVNWYHYQDFREAFPGHDVVADRLFVADGPRITCAGGAGSAALATHLIEQHLGRAQAQKATQVLLFDRPRQGSDAQPHPPLSEGISEPRVRRALLLMEQNLTRTISIGAIADELGVSTRQLERLCRENVGVGPASLYRQLRMRYASWLIQNTDRSMTDIAIETGFADCAHFSRQFKDAYGISPSTHRLQPNRVANTDAARSRVFD